jgi:hypothetical protein
MKRTLPPTVPLDQQPTQRVVGKRLSRPPGQAPDAAARAAMQANARYPTRVPKGVFRYSCHEEMTRDRERWTLEAIVEKQRGRA